MLWALLWKLFENKAFEVLEAKAAELIPRKLRVWAGQCLKVMVPPNLDPTRLMRTFVDRGHSATFPQPADKLVPGAGPQDYQLVFYKGFWIFSVLFEFNDTIELPSSVAVAPRAGCYKLHFWHPPHQPYFPQPHAGQPYDPSGPHEFFPGAR